VAASAAPYGYTITIWSSGAVCMDLLGKPHVAEVLIFMAGAVLAFVVVEVAAYGSFRVRLVPGEPPAIAVWGNMHVGSAGLAIFLVWVSDHIFDGWVGWPVAGFVATSVYLVLTATQITLASAAGASRGLQRPGRE
jgi:hypothetical protein